MKDYYSILGVDRSATADSIKKAYRKLAMQYHPDKNQGDTAAADRFREIAEAYETLGDESKRRTYDKPQHANTRPNNTGFGFEEWVNNFSGDFKNTRTRENARARSSQGRTHTPPRDTEYLNIYLDIRLDLGEALIGKKAEFKFSRKVVKYTSSVGQLINYTRETEEKEIAVTVNLAKTYLLIKKEGDRFLAKVRISKLGNEDVDARNNIWGEVEQTPIFGDVIITVEFTIPDNLRLEDNHVIQYVDIPLYKLITKGEKIRVETIIDKKYDAEINQPEHLNNLKFILSGKGILNSANELGDYIIRFNVITPNLNKLNKESRENFLKYLKEV